MNTSCQWQKWPRATKQWLTHRTKAGWCSTWGMTITRRPLASGFRIITWHWGILRPILVDFHVKCFNLGNLLSWLICFSSAKREEMIYRPHYIQAQLRTESVHSVTGPGQRTKRNYVYEQGGSLQGGCSSQMAIDVLKLKSYWEVLDSRHATNNLYVSLAPGFSYFCFHGFHRLTRISTSSFFCASV